MDAEHAANSGPHAGSPAPDAGPTPSDRARGDELLGLITEAEQQLTQLRQVHAERERERRALEAREATLGEREREQTRQAELTRQAHDAAETRLRQVRALGEEMEQRKSLLESRWHELNEAQQAAAESSQRRASEIEARAAMLEEREQRLATQAAAISRQRESADAMAVELAARDEALRAKSIEAQNATRELDAVSARVADAERRADEAARLARESVERSAPAFARLQELERALEDTRDRSDQRATTLQEELKAAAEARETLLAQMREREASSEDARTQLAAAREAAARLAEVVGGRARELAERDARIADLETKLGAATEKLREICREIASKEDGGERAKALTRELATRDERLAGLEARLAASQSKQRELEAERETLSKLLEQADMELSSARTETPAHTRSGELDPELLEAIETRRRRLHLLKSLLREQATKIRGAGEVLRSRYQQCEQVLAQRAELAAARTGMLEAQRRLERLQSRAAKSRVTLFLLYLAGLLGVLGMISWAATGQIAPATYAARAVIKPDTSAGAPSEGQLAEWQRFHESLLLDPQMVQTAAERMGRRGIATLETPGKLLDRLKNDLDSQSSRAGELVLELRGQGAARTARELDTYVTALVSQANAARDRRADGLGTVIADVAGANAGPIADARPIYAAGVFGAFLLVTGSVGFGMWRRLSAAKVRFEQEAQIDAVLDEANWQDPRAHATR